MDNKLVLSVDENSAPVKLVYFKVYSYEATETVDLEYDGRGNLIKDKQFTYSWNPENRPATIKDTLYHTVSKGNKKFPKKVSYIYDAFGRRVVTQYKGRSAEKNEWKSFITIYDGILPIEQFYLDDSGTKAKFYYNGMNPIRADIDSDFDGKLDKTYLPILDDRGTLVGVANDSGELIERLYYNSTGLMKSFVYVKKNDNSGEWIENLDDNGLNIARSQYLPFGWTGMYKDRFTGHYHTHFREYDPIHGRWLSQDPAGYMDGLNLYGMYADVNGADYLGLYGEDSWYDPGDWFETLGDVAGVHSWFTNTGRAAKFEMLKGEWETAKGIAIGIKDIATGTAQERNADIAASISGDSYFWLYYNTTMYSVMDAVPGVSSAQQIIPVDKSGWRMSSMARTQNALMNVSVFAGLWATAVGMPAKAGSFQLLNRRELATIALIEKVNPKGCTTNCINASIAGDASLGGNPASPLPSNTVPYSQLPGIMSKFNFSVIRNISLNSIKAFIKKAGPSARGTVIGYTADGAYGHAFNVINKGGKLIFVDAQNASIINLSKFSFFDFIPTN